MIEGWRYYNHAAIPNCAPHEMADLTPLEDGRIWKMKGRPLLARWISDWDCGIDTQWWFCIKEGPYRLEDLPGKERKHIRQATKANRVVMVNHWKSLLPELYRVYCEAYEFYRGAPSMDSYELFCRSMQNGDGHWDLWLSYDEGRELTGYITVIPHDGWASISTAKFDRKARSIRSSTALYNRILEHYLNELGMRYLSSGERSILHETNTQEYKERTFGFRKAFCRLNIQYNPWFGVVVAILYPFRMIFARWNDGPMIRKVNSILKMEMIRRSYLMSKVRKDSK